MTCAMMSSGPLTAESLCFVLGRTQTCGFSFWFPSKTTNLKRAKGYYLKQTHPHICCLRRRAGLFPLPFLVFPTRGPAPVLARRGGAHRVGVPTGADQRRQGGPWDRGPAPSVVWSGTSGSCKWEISTSQHQTHSNLTLFAGG